MTSGIKAAFSKPSNGWMTFDLETPEAHFSFSVSCVPNDFLWELLSALILAKSGVESKALANAEPHIAEFHFVPTGHDEITLQVVEHGGRQRVGMVPFVHCGTTDSIVLPFWRAVKKLQSEISPEEYLAAMKWEFPADQLGRLSQLLKNL